MFKFTFSRILNLWILKQFFRILAVHKILLVTMLKSSPRKNTELCTICDKNDFKKKFHKLTPKLLPKAIIGKFIYIDIYRLLTNRIYSDSNHPCRVSSIVIVIDIYLI